MLGRRTYKVELTADELVQIITLLEMDDDAHDYPFYCGLIAELKEIQKVSCSEEVKGG